MPPSMQYDAHVTHVYICQDNPLTDADRFAQAMRQVVGRRLTYADLTGKNDSPRHVPMGTGQAQQTPEPF